MHDLIIKNGRVVTPLGIMEGGLAVDDGIITEVAATRSLGQARKELDVQGKVIFPGMFDPHMHLGSGDERTYEDMTECFAEDTKDMAIGGVTTLATTNVFRPDPLVECLEKSIACGAGRSWIDFKFTGVILNYDHIKEIPELARRGCVSYKLYTGYCCDQAERMGMRRDGVGSDMFYLVGEQLREIGRPSLVMIHAEEPSVRNMLRERFKAQGRADLIAWAEHSPEWAESVQVYQYGVIAKELGIPLYVVHISRAHTVDFVAWLQSQGYPIIGETVTSFLATTAHEMHERGVGIYAKIQPPIRFASDRDRLWRGIREGTISAVGTDTIPYTRKYKDAQDFWEARPGLNIQAIDTLPLLLTEGYGKGRCDLESLARVLAETPSRCFGLYPQKGVLQPGSDADIVVIDLDREETLGRHRMRGGSDYSIWEGVRVKGMPVMTFLRGELIAEEGEIVARRPHGHYVMGERPRRL
jgi:dihydroorotase-like cyclic amidohydrolase